jgi:hypothetical protein
LQYADGYTIADFLKNALSNPSRRHEQAAAALKYRQQQLDL